MSNIIIVIVLAWCCRGFQSEWSKREDVFLEAAVLELKDVEIADEECKGDKAHSAIENALESPELRFQIGFQLLLHQTAGALEAEGMRRLRHHMFILFGLYSECFPLSHLQGLVYGLRNAFVWASKSAVHDPSIEILAANIRKRHDELFHALAELACQLCETGIGLDQDIHLDLEGWCASRVEIALTTGKKDDVTLLNAFKELRSAYTTAASDVRTQLSRFMTFKRASENVRRRAKELNKIDIPNARHVTNQHLIGNIKIPWVGLGTGCISADEGMKEKRMVSVMVKALQAGYRFFDTAESYGNLGALGKALKIAGVPRQNVTILSKVALLLECKNRRPESCRIRDKVQAQLKALNTSYLDLLSFHHHFSDAPFSVDSHFGVTKESAAYLNEASLRTAMGTLRPEEALELMHQQWAELAELQKEGIVRQVGFGTGDIAEMLPLLKAEVPPMFIANEINVLQGGNSQNEQPFFKIARQLGLGLVAHQPLKIMDHNEPHILLVAARNNLSFSQVVLAWGKQRGALQVPCSQNEHHLHENLASDGITLSEVDLDVLDSLGWLHRLCPSSRQYGRDLYGLHDSLLTSPGFQAWQAGWCASSLEAAVLTSTTHAGNAIHAHAGTTTTLYASLQNATPQRLDL